MCWSQLVEGLHLLIEFRTGGRSGTLVLVLPDMAWTCARWARAYRALVCVVAHIRCEFGV